MKTSKILTQKVITTYVSGGIETRVDGHVVSIEYNTGDIVLFKQVDGKRVVKSLRTHDGIQWVEGMRKIAFPTWKY